MGARWYPSGDIVMCAMTDQPWVFRIDEISKTYDDGVSTLS
jgi:hypothetical protein